LEVRVRKFLGNAILTIGVLLLGVFAIVLAAIVLSQPRMAADIGPKPPTYAEKHGDQQLAYLLVKLELKTRAVMRDHYARAQSPIPPVDLVYKRWLAKNAILPAAVADRVFSEVVPGATGGRAWVKMVVEQPRNPHNRGDSTALEMLSEIKKGGASAERSAPDACYYAEPIKATQLCLPCHGDPKGSSDPIFPQFKRDGWRVGDTIGAVVARVAPEK
jgi:hypothetical protein